MKSCQSLTQASRSLKVAETLGRGPHAPRKITLRTTARILRPVPGLLTASSKTNTFGKQERSGGLWVIQPLNLTGQRKASTTESSHRGCLPASWHRCHCRDPPGPSGQRTQRSQLRGGGSLLRVRGNGSCPRCRVSAEMGPCPWQACARKGR